EGCGGCEVAGGGEEGLSVAVEVDAIVQIWNADFGGKCNGQFRGFFVYVSNSFVCCTTLFSG
ncbi:hypothetical protein A2U01_0045887, partial [Trifolium medium]|nr:hypothetical protein [Trifolium medium]